MNYIPQKIALILLLSIQVSCSVLGLKTVEEQSYQILYQEDKIEIRSYPARIIATTESSGDYKEAQRKAFRRLADYIFGNNKTKTQLAMTSPVQQSMPKSEKIAMTAPVTQSKSGKNWSMSFSMPSSYKKISDLPTPNDSRVKIIKKKAETFASIRYTWSANEKRNKEQLNKLCQWLEKNDSYEIIDKKGFYAGYNPPWTIPFLRHNEMLVKVRKKSS